MIPARLWTCVCVLGVTALRAQTGIPIDRTYVSFGDSISAGAGASIPANRYVNLVAADRKLNLTNLAVSGSMAIDQADAIYETSVAPGDLFTYMIGVNDERKYGADPNEIAVFQSAVSAELAWLCLPSARKVTAQGGGVAYAGAWYQNTYYGGTLGKIAYDAGASASFQVSGTTVFIGVTVVDHNSAQFGLVVDGVNYGVFNGYGVGPVLASSGRIFGPSLIRIPNLAAGAHSVTLTVLSQGGLGVYFDWAGGAGVGVSGQRELGGTVYQGNVIRSSPAIYAQYGGSDQTVVDFNVALLEVVRTMQSDGLNVFLVDCYPRIDPVTELVDGVHPNDIGHQHLSAAFQQTMERSRRR